MNDQSSSNLSQTKPIIGSGSTPFIADEPVSFALFYTDKGLPVIQIYWFKKMTVIQKPLWIGPREEWDDVLKKHAKNIYRARAKRLQRCKSMMTVYDKALKELNNCMTTGLNPSPDYWYFY